MSNIAPPGKGKFYHGVYPGGSASHDEEISKESFTCYVCAAGRQTAWVIFSHEWSRGRLFPSQTVQWIHDNAKAVPFIRLMMRSSLEQFVCEPVYTLKAILDGKFDADLNAWGRDAAEAAVPLICEWGSEANGVWFPWNAAHNGGPKGTPLFRDAYRRIMDKIAEGGAKDITWVLHVNWDSNPKDGWNHMSQYDPNDERIAWIGVSAYGAQTPQDPGWPSLVQSLDSAWPALHELAKKRPIMLCEFGVTDGHCNDSAPKWADDAFAAILSGRYPGLAGFSWWNEGWENPGGHATEMRIEQITGMPDVFRKHLVGNSKVIDHAVIK